MVESVVLGMKSVAAKANTPRTVPYEELPGSLQPANDGARHARCPYKLGARVQHCKEVKSLD